MKAVGEKTQIKWDKEEVVGIDVWNISGRLGYVRSWVGYNY